MAKTKNKEKQNRRAPIVAILGHVDHGKTTILDFIRKANVQKGEVGGITQKISVFTVKHGEIMETGEEGEITFIDTPGHEAFNLMRSRGGSIADVVLLIVAADDGIKPQTVESIEIIKKSSARPIVVINKIDLPNVNVEKIKRELSNHGIQVEGFGGTIPVVEVSGKTGQGIPDLLDTINLIIDVEGLVDRGVLDRSVKGKGFALESVKDSSKGFVTSLVVTQGEFVTGDWIAYRSADKVVVEKIKGFISENNISIEKLEDGHGAKVLGLSDLVDLGEVIWCLEEKDMKLANALLEKKVVAQVNVDDGNEGSEEVVEAAWFTDMFGGEQVEESSSDEGGELNVILKSSSEGSLEALVKSIENIVIDGYKVKLINKGIGDITIKDVDRAEVTKSIILGFEVGADSDTLSIAEKKRVLIRTYDLIYKLTEEITDALTIMSTPKESEEEIGSATVKAIFTLSNGDQVVGARVISGIVKIGVKCYIVRNDEIVAEGKIRSLRNQKNEIKEAQKGAEFGAIIEPKPEVLEGDEIHCFKIVK